MCSKWFPPDSNSSDSYYCCPRGFDIINFFILWDFLQGQNIIVLSKSKDTDCIIIYICVFGFYHRTNTPWGVDVYHCVV